VSNLNFQTSWINVEQIYTFKQGVPECISIKYHGKKILFSKRESECLVALAKGKTYKQIAQQLNISPRTVESHINSIKRRSGCHFKSQIIDLIWESCVHSI
jgi:DNA-binding CsgD family transcriptional regulator